MFTFAPHSLEPAVILPLRTVDHTSYSYLPGFYTGTALYRASTEAQGCEKIAPRCYAWVHFNKNRNHGPPNASNDKIKQSKGWCFLCRIYLFSSLVARVFNKLTRYSFADSKEEVMIWVLWTEQCKHLCIVLFKELKSSLPLYCQQTSNE